MGYGQIGGGLMTKLADLPVGTGLLADAKKVLASREYQLHVQEAKQTGDTPMTPEEWIASKKADKDAEAAAFNEGKAK